MKLEETKLSQFHEFLFQRNIAFSTSRIHLLNLKRIFREISNFTYEEIITFLLKQKEKEKKASYINNLINTIRIFAQFSKADPRLQALKFLPEKPPSKATMSDEEIEAFLALPAPKNASKQDYDRWTLFFSIMAYTGMRPGEVAHLKVENVDFGRNVFILEETKTHQPRYVPIPPNILEKLRVYVSELKGEYLFPSKKGGNTNRTGCVFDSVDWHYNFHSRIKRLGIKRKNLTPYSFRHSFITRMLEEDVNIFKVQKIVGHRQIETTAQYTHLTTKDIQLAIQKHPLVRKSTSPYEILKAVKNIIESFNIQADKRFSFKITEEEKRLKIEIEII